MFDKIINFYRVSSAKQPISDDAAAITKKYKYFKWSTFLSATLGYGLYYVCRLSLNVVKKPIVAKGYPRKRNWESSGRYFFSHMQ